MSRTFQLITDSSCDLPADLIRSLDLDVIQLSVTMDNGNKTVQNDQLVPADFYQRLRSKESIKTSAVSTAFFLELFEKYAREGKDVLYIGFSSGLSATYAAGKNAAEEISEKYPERNILTVDSLCASMGQGLLVYLVAKYSENGTSVQEVAQYAEQLKLRVCHEFTVDDLFFLHRGGRVSAATAVVGSMLSIKPILHVDNEGHLINVGKARGRINSLKVLCDKLCANAIDVENQTVFISHGDCLDDANKLADMIRERAGVKDIVISYVGPVIGAHSGPGTLALFFVANER